MHFAECLPRFLSRLWRNGERDYKLHCRNQSQQLADGQSRTVMYSCSSELLHSSTCTCAWAKFKSPPGEKPPVPAEFKFVREESTGSRMVSSIAICCGIMYCSSVLECLLSQRAVKSVTVRSCWETGKTCQESEEYLQDRLFCFAHPYSWVLSWKVSYCVTVLTLEVCGTSAFAQPAKNKNTRFSGACLEGENSWLLGVATAVGAACLKSAVQDSPELAALVRNRLFMNCIWQRFMILWN